ncbi:MAG: MBL fold metallo-hydrolase [bacterium]|nr:MBL fold metallo-hydrolase [bacterium]
MKYPNAQITFYGGAGEVTGANMVFEYKTQERTTRIMLDCGLIQGKEMYGERNFEKFPYDVKSIDALAVSHGHIDHIGRVPKLVKEGYEGPIYSSKPTKALAEIMLVDSRGVMLKEIRRRKQPELYSPYDIGRTLGQWHTLEYHQEVRVKDVDIKLYRSGHILGGAMIELSFPGSDGTVRKLVYTGDLGHPQNLLLNDTEQLESVDFLLIESVYGDRDHEDRSKRVHLFEDVIEDTIRRGGTLMIPAFSVEKTQELLFEINEMVEHGRIPEVPVFLDSPLAIKVTRIFKRFAEYFNPEVQKIIQHDEDIFRFPGFTPTLRTEESKSINDVSPPKIIIAGSGMSNGGRILHHEKRYLSDEKSTILFTGYQTPGSLGRLIQEGSREVTIHGETIPVRCHIVTIGGYSSHRDSTALLEYAHHNVDSVKEVFVVLGEQRSSMFLAQRLRDYVGVMASVPEQGSTHILEI